MSLLLLFFLLFYQFFFSLSSDIKFDNSNACGAPGDSRDFSALTKPDTDYFYQPDPKIPSAYIFNVCSDTIRSCSGHPTPGIFSYDLSQEFSCYVLGDLHQPIWSTSSVDVNLTYSNGEQCYFGHSVSLFSMTIVFQCSPFQEANIVSAQMPECQAKIVIDTKYACPGIHPIPPLPPKPILPAQEVGLSGGSYFCIFFFVFFFAYFAGGCLWKRSAFGATGYESLPHVDFWRDLPSLVREGFTFSSNILLCRDDSSRYHPSQRENYQGLHSNYQDFGSNYGSAQDNSYGATL